MSDDCLVGHMTRWGNVPSDISQTSIEFALGHLNIYGFAVWANTVADDHLSEIYFSFTNLSNIKLTIKNTRTKYTLFFLFTTLILSLPNRSIGSFLRVHRLTVVNSTSLLGLQDCSSIISRSSSRIILLSTLHGLQPPSRIVLLSTFLDISPIHLLG